MLWDQLISDLNRLGGVDGNTKTGIQKQPNQPAFLAHNVASVLNQTGNGAAVTVPFATGIYDQASNYNNGTYIYTAPVSGIHHFDVLVTVSDLTAAMTGYTLNLVTSNHTYTRYNSWAPVVADSETLELSRDVYMDVGDTAYVTVMVARGAGNTADILGTASPIYTSFSGHLVA